MFRLFHAIQMWREKHPAMTDEDFEQTPANIQEYQAFRRLKIRLFGAMGMAYTGSVLLGVTFLLDDPREPYFWRVIFSPILLYGFGFFASLRFKEDETLFIMGLRQRRRASSPGRARQRYTQFFWRGIIIGALYMAFLLLAGLLKTLTGAYLIQ